MATIIEHERTTGGSGGNGNGFLVGMILLVVLAVLFFVYGLPYISGSMRNTAPQVNVPGKIDVNVNGGAGK